MPPSRASAMTLPVDGPMPGRSSSVPSAWCCGELVVAELAHEVARLGVGLHPSALGQRPVEQVHDAVERVGRRHRRCSSPANLPARELASAVRASAVAPVPWPTHGTVRVRRSPQRGQVVAVQRARRRRRAGRALRLRHHRPERRRGQGARPAPRRAWPR